MICPVCGTENGNTTYCISCGANMSGGTTAQNNQYSAYQQPAYQQPAYQQPTIPAEYKPISAWGYFGYQLLFAIPLVGFIMLLVFSFGGSTNINLKNYARSYWCGLLISTILFVVIFLISMIIYAAEYA